MSNKSVWELEEELRDLESVDEELQKRIDLEKRIADKKASIKVSKEGRGMRFFKAVIDRIRE